MNDNQIKTTTETAAGHATRRLATVMPAIFAVAFGLFMVYGVGFAHPSTIHNAAHDARHAFAFPCH